MMVSSCCLKCLPRLHCGMGPLLAGRYRCCSAVSLVGIGVRRLLCWLWVSCPKRHCIWFNTKACWAPNWQVHTLLDGVWASNKVPWCDFGAGGGCCWHNCRCTCPRQWQPVTYDSSSALPTAMLEGHMGQRGSFVHSRCMHIAVCEPQPAASVLQRAFVHPDNRAGASGACRVCELSAQCSALPLRWFATLRW